MVARITIVDDDPQALRLQATALMADGHEVHQACGIESALASLEQGVPDLMIVDVMMPEGTEGFHLVWMLRESDDEKIRRIPIIMLTSLRKHTALRFYPSQSDGTFQPGEFLPIQGWLEKPFDPWELRSMVRDLLTASQG